MILDWNKPKRAMPVERWQAISADSAPPGVYVPNMSKEDKEKWKAKLVGAKSGKPQVEIRRTFNGTQMLIIVSNGGFAGKFRSEGYNIHISANGPAWMNWKDWANMQEAVKEAGDKLAALKEVK